MFVLEIVASEVAVEIILTFCPAKAHAGVGKVIIVAKLAFVFQCRLVKDFTKIVII